MQIKFETLNGTILVDCASTTAREDVMRLLVVMHRLVERDFDTLTREPDDVLHPGDGDDDWDD